MTAVKLGCTQYNHDAQFKREITGPKGSVTVAELGPPYFSGTFIVHGMERRAYCAGLGDALALARALVGLEPAS